jgi:hypothetical protein
MLTMDLLNQQSTYKALHDFLYTPIEDAIDILYTRQRQHLALPIIDVPEPLKPNLYSLYNPYPLTAVLCRHVATPNFEMRRVIELCEKYPLNLLILTFQEDKFSTNNTCKYALGHMGFFNGFGRNGGEKICYRTVINFNHYDGYLLRECKTIRGESFVKFHHDLLLQGFPELNVNNIFDNSAWFIEQHAKAGNLYREFLKMFLKHAILFETFVLSGSELDFTINKVLPAFQEIVDNFGMKPLIVATDPPDTEGDNYWQLYPEHLQPSVHFDRRRTPRYEPPFEDFKPTKILGKQRLIR